MSETAKASAMTQSQGMRVQVMRTQLGQVRGLGAAHHGTELWWAERLTSAALVPLTLWFVLAAFHLAGLPRVNVAHWAANPVNATLLIALVTITFYHMQLGLQVVIDDYVHGNRTRMALLLTNKGVAVLLCLASVVAILKLAFTG
jgi:succinate dehydrogenase / fumarate reductase, membrane anchor subunit